MKIPTTYDYVAIRHPELMDEFDRQRRASSSKSKDTPPQELEYSYDVAVEITGAIFGDDFFRKLESGELQREHEEQQRREREITEEEFKRDLLSRMYVNVVAKAGRMRLYSKPLVLEYGKMPQPVQDYLDRSWQQHLDTIAEGERFAALSPEEQEAETSALLAELRRSPGFL